MRIAIGTIAVLSLVLSQASVRAADDASGSSDDNSVTAYIVVEYMSVPNGADDLYLQLENIWHEVHTVRRDLGIIRAWAMCKVKRTEGPDADYNYAVVHLYDSWDKIENPFPWPKIEEHLSELTDVEQAVVDRTGEARTMVRTEMWELQDVALAERWGQGAHDRLLKLAFMKSKTPDKHAEIEKSVWKKVWAQVAKEGIHWNWHLWSRRFPGGANHPFDSVAVHLFPEGEPNKQPPEDWWDTAASKVFPGKSTEEIDELFEPTDEVRTIPIQEDWEILAYVEPLD